MEKNEETQIFEYEDKYKEQIIELISECLVDQGVLPASCIPIDDDDLQHIPDIYSGRGKFWVAINENRVIGTIGVQEYKGDTAKLRRMFVQKEYRGTGLAKKLLDTALQFAKEIGYIKITLNTHINMKRAHSFYKKNNFSHIGNKNDQMMTFEREL